MFNFFSLLSKTNLSVNVTEYVILSIAELNKCNVDDTDTKKAADSEAVVPSTQL